MNRFHIIYILERHAYIISTLQRVTTVRLGRAQALSLAHGLTYSFS